MKRVCSLGRAARAKAQIKVRQPVAQVLVKPRNAEEGGALRKNAQLVLEELNARALELLDDETVVVRYDVKPNLPVLGRKYGAEVAPIRAGLAALPAAEVAEAVRRGRTVSVAGHDLEPEDILLQAQDTDGFASASDAGYTVAITTAISAELADEGLARELVRRIQDMRREAGFVLSDRITTWYAGDADIARVMQSQAAYIQAETLSTELVAGAPPRRRPPRRARPGGCHRDARRPPQRGVGGTQPCAGTALLCGACPSRLSPIDAIYCVPYRHTVALFTAPQTVVLQMAFLMRFLFAYCRLHQLRYG